MEFFKLFFLLTLVCNLCFTQTGTTGTTGTSGTTATSNTDTATDETEDSLLAQDSGTRILTVGYGTFTIILSILLQLLITFFIGRSSRYPEIIFLISLIIPLFVILFFVYAPKNAEKNILEQQEIETNPWYILQVFAIIIAVFSFLMNGIVMLAITFFRGVKAIRISSQLEMERDRQKIEREKLKEKKRRAEEEVEEIDNRINQGIQNRAQN